MMWEVETATAQTDEEWTSEYVLDILASRPSHTPLPKLTLGTVTASWFPTEPGIAFIETKGGSPDDRVVAEAYLREWLRNSGWKQAQYTLFRNDLKKQAAWPDIEAKAKRLIQSGNVQLLRNGPQNIVGYVIGDHGEYQTEISREDPNGQAITQWQCECPWDQYAWQRTRQWKKYEGRPCAHVLATYWASQSAPLDEEVSPGTPQTTLFDPGTAQPQPPQTNTPAQAPPQPAQLSIPGVSLPPPEAQPPPQVIPAQERGAPAPPGVVSVPGARPQSPADPTQFPGGTFSRVAADEDWPLSNRPLLYDTQTGDIYIGLPGANHYSIAVPPEVKARWKDLRDAVVDTEERRIEWYEDKYNVWNDVQKEAVRQYIRDNLNFEPSDHPGEWAWTAATQFENSDMVRLEEDEYGITEGKSEEHGAGQFKLIPANSIGEVLGQDPSTGWVDVAFAGPQAGAGPLEPYHVRAWIEPSKLTPMPNVKKPGPFIRRRR